MTDREDTAKAAETPSLAGPLPWGPSFRLRIVAYLVLFALIPVGVAAWAISRQEAENEAAQADASLNASLRAAVEEFIRTLDEASSRAEALAVSPAVQNALRTRDRATLRALARRRPNVLFFSGTATLAGTPTRPAAQRTVEVISGERTFGQVMVEVPLDRRLRARLSRAAGLADRDELVIAEGGLVVQGPNGRGEPLELGSNRPRDIDLAGSSYRAIAAPLTGTDQDVELAVLRPRAVIDAAASRLERRVLLGGLGALVLIALLAYAGAPAIARGRISQQQRAQAAQVLAHVGDGVMLVDGDGVLRLWNRAAEAITGVSAEAALGRRLSDVLPGWETVAGVVPVARGGEPFREAVRGRSVPLDVAGTELWLSVTGVGFAEGTVFTFRDLTEQRRLEELKTDFLTTVSHELRTPVAAVYGAAAILEERGEVLDEEARQELLGIVYQQSERLARLVDDVLVAGQLSAGQLPVADETFDAAELVRSVVDETPASLRDGASIEVVAPPELPLVAADSAKARQVLANLIENAFKYSPAGRRVEIVLDPRVGFLRFGIRDEGIGIAANEQERIFEKFYRVDPEMTRGIAGTGLGLYICRELVKHMDGRIWVASTPGAGSTFWLELPVRARRPAAVLPGQK